MPEVFNLDQIKEILKHVDSIEVVEEGFVAYSRGRAVVPPVGELLLENPPGEVHITAVGSDTPEKNELDPRILQQADIVVADSISQCLSRGEIYQSIKAGLLRKENLVELGNVIVNRGLGRTSDDQLTVADLTGVAVQDIQISKAVYEALV